MRESELQPGTILQRADGAFGVVVNDGKIAGPFNVEQVRRIIDKPDWDPSENIIYDPVKIGK